ncbi:hypothetical protein B0H94_10494 [Salsuginibacillus halophilus]|uniref:Outer surface protein n=1 Tax=Salsuginibacillus halophilus TaxID=517424 RepID=A0A2P8HQN6_9BACI|nr:MupG family TIM beta-alpha barrel fold protein [Salsuginibacillus halophilus]PSL48494.1 hypothetical protein B0H94_10494 [Salsuginibacillus halophilus]
MYGFSLYLNEPMNEKRRRYMQEMHAAGFSYIFTSIHIPEEDQTLYKRRLEALAEEAASFGLTLITDSSPAALPLLDHLEGPIHVRIDHSLQAEQMADLAKRHRIILNASTCAHAELTSLRNAGLNLGEAAACHNFYPRPETGLDRSALQAQNALLKSEGLRIAAFVPGDGAMRGPLERGLPTLEEHRGAAPFASAVSLWRGAGVDDVIIGDPDLSKEAQTAFSRFKDGLFPVRATLFPATEAEAELLSLTHYRRPDPARDVVRSETARPHAASCALSIAPLSAPAPRPRGAITIDNSHYGRYEGELQLVKQPLPPDPCVNVVGQIIDADVSLLEHIEAGEAFQLRPMR